MKTNGEREVNDSNKRKRKFVGRDGISAIEQELISFDLMMGFGHEVSSSEGERKKRFR